VTGNTVKAPRWAGILCHYDGANIAITGNVITDHQGRTNTGAGGATPQAGAPIFISGGAGAAYLGNITVVGNVIENYGTQISPPVSYFRTGGIVVNEAKTQGVSIKNNRIQTGNANGICIADALNVTAESNEVSGAYGQALNSGTAGSGRLLTYAISALRYGTTANRPTLQSTQQGFQYWDADLTKPIWWNGTVWKDASNATV
jgi:hypothetical protein